MIEHIHKSLDLILQKHPDAAIMLVGDFNMFKAGSIMRIYKLKQIAKKPTKENNTLDKVFTNMANFYREPVVLPPLRSLTHGHCVVICQPCIVTERPTNMYIVEVSRNDRTPKLFSHMSFSKLHGLICTKCTPAQNSSTNSKLPLTAYLTPTCPSNWLPGTNATNPG